MSQLCKLEAQTEIKSSPDKFYDIYKKKTYLQLKIVPGKIQSIQVLEGDGETAGSIRLWTYIMGKFMPYFFGCGNEKMLYLENYVINQLYNLRSWTLLILCNFTHFVKLL